MFAGNEPVLVHNNDGKQYCDHVVLGVNPHSDDLAAELRAAGDSQAHTFNGKAYAGMSPNGRPLWMEGIEAAVGDRNVKISVVLDGLPGKTPEEAFANAYRRGLPIQDSWKEAARSGNGTAWELARLGNKARLGSRVCGTQLG